MIKYRTDNENMPRINVINKIMEKYKKIDQNQPQIPPERFLLH